jgi:regulator of replication initiation timing
MAKDPAATLRVEPESPRVETAAALHSKIGKLQAEIGLLRFKMIEGQKEAHMLRIENARLRARIETLVKRGAE